MRLWFEEWVRTNSAYYQASFVQAFASWTKKNTVKWKKNCFGIKKSSRDVSSAVWSRSNGERERRGSRLIENLIAAPINAFGSITSRSEKREVRLGDLADLILKKPKNDIKTTATPQKTTRVSYLLLHSWENDHTTHTQQYFHFLLKRTT